MKKYYYSLFAAVSLLLAVTSCSQEEDFPKSSNGVTSFSISLDGAVGSRTAGDGETANKLFYEVYLDGESVHKGDTGEEVISLDKPFNLDLPLLNGETYSIVFWAQNEGCSIYDLENLNKISIDYQNATLLANQESYDAFYNALVNFKADGNTHKVELRRPFAQLNLGTSDWTEVKNALKGQDPVTTTSVTVTGLADEFFPLTGVAKGNDQTPVEATFGYAGLYTWQENGETKDAFQVNGVDYKYLSLNYLLVPGTKTPNGTGVYEAETDDADKALVDLTFNLKRGETELQPIKVTNAPMRRNWRTNIIGDVLTGTSFDIVIAPGTDGDNNVDVESINGLTALNTALTNNTSEEQVIYNISGLSTTDNVIIDIPTTFVAAQVTFNFNDIKDDANLTIKDANDGSYANTVCVSLPTTEGHKLTTTTIILPEAHVELVEGNFGNLSASTNDETIVVRSGATVGKLTVNKGNVEIYGTVTTIKAGESNNAPIIVVLGENVTEPSIVEGEGEIIFKPENSIAQVGSYYYETLKEALNAIETEGTITMIADYENAESVSIPEGKTITLELNGFSISGTDETEKNYGLIDNRGTLTITGEGKISVKATVNSGWNRYSAALANNPGGNLTVGKGVVVEHLGGTDMAYGIDNLTNGKGTSAIVTIDGATVKSPYRAIRQFLNGVEATNELYVVSGVIEGANKSVWMQDPNKNANTGKLVVSEDAQLKGDVYLFVTEGSTEWPVNVSIAADALAEDAEVLSGNVPAGYEIILEDGNWKVVKLEYVADGLYKRNDMNQYFVYSGDGLSALNSKMADKSAGKNIKVVLAADIDFTGKTWTPVDSHADTAFTFSELDGQGHTISNLTINGQAMFTRFAGSEDVVIKDVTFDKATVDSNGSINTSILTVQSYQNVLLDNVDVKNSTISGGYKVAPLIATVYNESSSSTVTATLKNCDVENVTVKASKYDFCTTGMVAFVYADDNDKIEFANCTVKGVNLMAPNDSYKAHAAIYTTGSETLFNEAEGVTVTDVTFTAL